MSTRAGLRPVETPLTALGGAILGGAAGYLIGGVVGFIVGAAPAGINGAFGGFRGSYAWRTARGWFAFVADSTWGLLGTTLGVVFNAINSLGRSTGYRADLSHHFNRHVFERGACMKRGLAFRGCANGLAPGSGFGLRQAET